LGKHHYIVLKTAIPKFQKTSVVSFLVNFTPCFHRNCNQMLKEYFSDYLLKPCDPSDDWVVLDFALGDGDGIGQHDGQGVEDGRVRSNDNHGSFRTGSLKIN
jgi:hypothetical protein